MPKEVSELASGAQFSRSSNEGQLADSQNRSFRILLNSPNEIVDVQSVCGVRIGDQHPYNANLYCVSFDARFDGDGRSIIAASFNYQTTPSSNPGGQDPKSQSPDVRLANWSINSSLYEIPIWSWRERTGARSWDGPKTAANGAKDMYDGVSALDALITISIQQFEPTDPTKHARHVGAVNKEEIKLGSLVMPPHTVMLRGISSQPVTESWGGILYRGWTCSYEFAYRANDTEIWIGTDEEGGKQTVELGWDVAIPQTGFNVKCFTPPGREIDDPFGQPLKCDDKTKELKDPPALSDGLAEGKKARAMLRVPVGDKSGQSPSASPIALNDNGRPRADDLDPIVRGYQVHRDINFTDTLKLRLL